MIFFYPRELDEAYILHIVLIDGYHVTGLCGCLQPSALKPAPDWYGMTHKQLKGKNGD